MFASLDSRRGDAGVVDVAFTDRLGGVSAPPFDSLDLGVREAERAAEVEANFALLTTAFDVRRVVVMRQQHGREVSVVQASTTDPPPCDALVTRETKVALCVRVADCVPVVMADADNGVAAVVHAGRRGVVEGVVTSTLECMRNLGADRVDAWVGPHVCGGCYEVPASMRAEVAAVTPTAFGCTTWGTPSVDLGAAVTAQLEAAGCRVTDRSRCTRESLDLYSHRRDGDRSGRSAGLVVLRAATDG